LREAILQALQFSGAKPAVLLKNKRAGPRISNGVEMHASCRPRRLLDPKTFGNPLKSSTEVLEMEDRPRVSSAAGSTFDGWNRQKVDRDIDAIPSDSKKLNSLRTLPPGYDATTPHHSGRFSPWGATIN
jgi:hypothetical protein